MTSRRLLEVECRRGEEVVVHFRPCLLAGVPRASLRHWRNANREFLLAVRSLLDGIIERMEPADAEAQGRRARGRRRVEVTEEEGT